jgi:NAD(P)H-hydrate repair Nnr-like enzyme with NAD(P)H-hydrate dehydratase domain
LFPTFFPAGGPGASRVSGGPAAAPAAQSGATVLLKGVPTVVARGGRPVLTVAAGNPGLATGGSGDVLSGLVGTALAQQLPPEPAAVLGAQALGRAGDLAARRTSARTIRPMDVVAALSDLWREWELLRLAPPPPRPPVLLELAAPQTV